MRSSDFPKLMISMAQSRNLDEVLRSIVTGISACSNVALTRIWMIHPGDICATCPLRAECADQSRCLHLVASAGNAGDPQADLTRINGRFRRFPLNVRKIGRIAASGEPLLVSHVQGGEDWIADPTWFRESRIRSFAGQPLIYRGEVLGVLALFDRADLGSDEVEWLRIFADHAAVSIANANAFEEIDFLKARLEEENEYLREEIKENQSGGDLVGDSPAQRKVLQQIALVAPTDTTVLITGESGTGKELVARAIHEGSTRRARAMIKVNCSAVPDALFESEFFGHMRGSFTGAMRDKPGRFELADGGTLFLDEIGDVPLPMQAKLLRTLQEQEIERVGDTRTRKINVRIIAATNRDLKADVEDGRFRQDLFYRLSVFPIENPPLRERREDIPKLAEHFIRSAAKKMDRKPPKFTQAAARQLAAQDWPGNVRELQNAIERAVILAQGGPLRFDPAPSLPLPARRVDTGEAPPSTTPPILTREALKARERLSIEAALQQTGGKIFGPNGSAALLGMKPTTLASRIKALGLVRK
jgi:transcriptional regulator with GAF, ATPase, and Fis domain